MAALTVHTLYEYGSDLRPHGSAYIRLLQPLIHPANTGTLRVTRGRSYAPADVVILERMWRPDISLAWATDLLEQVQTDRSRLIYTIDDNLLDLHWDGPGYQNFSAEHRAVIRLFAREADGIIVTTEALKQRLARLNKHIAVVPNALDERLWGAAQTPPGSPRRNNRSLVIGYMGTYTHDGDIMMILQALREILRAHADRVELQMIGGLANRAIVDAFRGLPLRILDVGDHVEYPSFVRWMTEHVQWDLAIAPLEDNAFTRCKSDIKFLDYSALGIPGIYSRVPAYEQSVRHLETGYLTSNNPDSWVMALDQLLSDDTLRLRIGQNAHSYLLSTRILKHRAPDWEQAIRAIATAIPVHVKG